MFPRPSNIRKQKDGEVDVDSVKETEVAVPLESAVTFKGDYLMETLDAEEKDQTVATSCDAAEKEAPKKASKVKKNQGGVRRRCIPICSL